MLTSITLNYTKITKNSNMQPVKETISRTVRADEMVIGNKTMTELGAIGFTDLRRFKLKYISDIKTSKINYIEHKGITYKVTSIKDDGSGRVITIDASIKDSD